MSFNEAYNEKELLLRIAEGDERAFTLFYEYYYNLLRPFVVRNAPSVQATDEILQMTFLRVWLNRHKLEDIENMRAWMIKIASREYLTYVRDTLSKQLSTDSVEENTKNIALHPDHKIEYSYAVKEIRGLVSDAVKNLSGQRSIVFRLSRHENLSIGEIAVRLQLAPKTVKNTLTAALNEIRIYLQVHGYDLIVIICATILHLS